MAKKIILNSKIFLLLPRTSNTVINYPILLLNNKTIKIEEIDHIFLKKDTGVCVVVMEGNVNNIDDNIYFFPMGVELINDLKIGNYEKIIVNNGYLDNFDNADNVLVELYIV